jgi:hypothetical protein
LVRTFTLGIVSLGLVTAPVGALAAEMGYLVKARVPVHCVVQQRAQGTAAADGAVSLGHFREYCNAPLGYELVVRYAPGALRGAVLTAGNDAVVLDGSGEAVLSRASGPRWIERNIVAKPGEQGFDTDRLELVVVPR